MEAEVARIRWGILGTGKIAAHFARALARMDDAELLAVGSRAQETAEAFGAAHGVPRCYASYDALVRDDEVDVVYVATPHVFHARDTLMCLAAGKAVLCEKPLTVNAREAAEVVAEARRRGLFLMEAMWTRFLPVTRALRRFVADGAIGEVQLVEVDFGAELAFDPESRLFKLELGGGALLDLGVYPLSLMSMLLGTPSEVMSLARLGESGVDELNAIICRYPSGALGLCSSATRVATPQEAVIAGTEGWIRLHAPWYRGRALTLRRAGELELFAYPYEGNGYQFEAAEVHRCLRAGLQESEVMPLDESVSLMATLDRVRSSWGLRYPQD
jgi:predicted dehydrogenase